MVAAMAVVSSMALGASAALEAIPDGWVFDPEYYAAQNPGGWNGYDGAV